MATKRISPDDVGQLHNKLLDAVLTEHPTYLRSASISDIARTILATEKVVSMSEDEVVEALEVGIYVKDIELPSDLAAAIDAYATAAMQSLKSGDEPRASLDEFGAKLDDRGRDALETFAAVLRHSASYWPSAPLQTRPPREWPRDDLPFDPDDPRDYQNGWLRHTTNHWWNMAAITRADAEAAAKFRWLGRTLGAFAGNAGMQASLRAWFDPANHIDLT